MAQSDEAVLLGHTLLTDAQNRDRGQTLTDPVETLTQLRATQLAAEMPSVALGAGAWWCHSLLAVSAVSNTLLLNEH